MWLEQSERGGEREEGRAGRGQEQMVGALEGCRQGNNGT